MVVSVGTDGHVSLRDTDDFTKFSVLTSEGVDTDDVLRRSAAGYLRDPDEGARIRVGWLREKALEMSLSAAWSRGLEGMLEYASSKNWLNDDGTISAHVELER
jgi:hypothetical protein